MWWGVWQDDLKDRPEKRDAQELLDRQLVKVYALMPTMRGATYEMLVQAIKKMRALYSQEESRFANHMLWFDAFLGRTTTVSDEDKRRIKEYMENFESLLDEGAFVRKRKAEAKEEGRREGLAEGREEGIAEGLQEALVFAVEVRFPPLAGVAQEKAKQIKQPEALRDLLKRMKEVSDENGARLLLDSIAA